MTDRAARNQAALLVRRFASGRITWGEFDDALFDLDFNAEDTAFVALAEEGFWWNERSPRRKLTMWVLFLQTDNEYRWPAEQLHDGVFLLLTIFIGVVGFLIWDNGYMLAGGCLIALTAIISSAREEYKLRCKRRGGNKSIKPFFHAHERKGLGNFHGC